MMRSSSSKINGIIKTRKNGSSGDAGGHFSGRGYCGFNEYGGGGYPGMIETEAMETCNIFRTTTAVMGVGI